jgi:hypothetical protein
MLPELSLKPSRKIAPFIGQLVNRCPAIRSVWTIGQPANGEGMDPLRRFDWELVAFADVATLHYLRRAADLHRVDVLLRIVTDGDRFEIAWGALERSGSLFSWGWRRATESEAYYSEAHWARAPQSGDVERTRRKAACVWQAVPPSVSRPGLRFLHHSRQ